jgi:hypothetical protein
VKDENHWTLRGSALSTWTYILPHGVAGQLACHSPITYWRCEKTFIRLLNDLAFDIYDDTEKRITAWAVREVKADILCLQEVENHHVLERFNSAWPGGMGYKYRILIDAHDPRLIDVAVLSRYPFTYINTHRDARNAANTSWLFSRDCLEGDIDIDGSTMSARTTPRRLTMPRSISIYR